MESIAKAILAVMAEVKGMEKNSKVGTGYNSYDGTKDCDVKEVFNEAMQKNGLCMIPISIEDEIKIERWQEPYQGDMKTKQSIFTKVKTKYLLLHSSGESIEVAGYGHGIDAQDKGAGKATTYAMKNALLYTFLTPVGKIDDTDTTHSNDIKTPTVTPVTKPTVTPELVIQITAESSKCNTIDELVVLKGNYEAAILKHKAIFKILSDRYEKLKGK